MSYHPDLVHLPIGLAVAIPFVALLIWVGIENETLEKRTWAVVLFLQGLMFVGILTARFSGENYNQIVEDHVRGANIFTALSILSIILGSLVIIAESYKRDRLFRGLTILSATAAAIAAVHVGHGGHTLVYEHGAAKTVEASKGPDVVSSPSPPH